MSTADLVRLTANGMSRSSRLVPVSLAILRGMACFFGRSADAPRLLGSLRVDASETTSILGWEPPTTIEDGIVETVKWYLASSAKRIQSQG